MSEGSSVPAKGLVKQLITEDMPVAHIVLLFPPAAEIMTEYGLHCSSCSIGGVESLKDGCAMHNLEPDMVVELLDDLNTALTESDVPKEPIKITKAAAQAILHVAKEQEHEGSLLTIGIDSSGGFCLEFTEAINEGDTVFVCEAEPEVQVCVSPLFLYRTAGSIIDEREGRMHLDLPKTECCKGKAAEECCKTTGNKESCGC